ncbi:MAG: aminoacyl-tRNA hydrolase [candidate division Zixibacteria bacterium]|nr:aminoacyl-tRNA hydrolase [candidate division Zixibacteria bacterium]
MLSLIVGLGNPKERYKSTRHNLGYRVVDYLATQNNKNFKPGKGDYLFCEVEEEKEKKFLLIKPLTFMNASGEVVVDALDHFSLGRENLLVLCDDINLPLGKIRIREKGTDGGHKGLKSIIYHLNSIDFARLRMGIGEAPQGMDLEEFVLKEFDQEEKETVERMIEKACAAVENTLIWGLEDSMSRFNA